MATKKPSNDDDASGNSIPVLSEVVSVRRPAEQFGPDKSAALQTERVAQTLKRA